MSGRRAGERTSGQARRGGLTAVHSAGTCQNHCPRTRGRNGRAAPTCLGHCCTTCCALRSPWLPPTARYARRDRPGSRACRSGPSLLWASGWMGGGGGCRGTWGGQGRVSVREGARVDVGVGCWGLRAGSEIDKSASAPGAEWMAMVPLTSQRKEKREERLKKERALWENRSDQDEAGVVL